ncbi:hypothetical protein JCM19992_14520 [Thermostilla marina]
MDANTPKPKKKAGMLGLGLDGDDGQTRITRGKNFFLYGGSKDTHAIMQETAIKINEQLKERGKALEDVSPQEFRDIVHKVTDSIGIRKQQG